MLKYILQKINESVNLYLWLIFQPMKILRGNKMIKLTVENTAKAIERCKQLKPIVRFVADRIFNVSSARNENTYQVSFAVKNGEKFGQCTCKASERNMVCYHIIGAATANIYRQGLKRQTA